MLPRVSIPPLIGSWLPQGDFVTFTFLLGTMAMFAAGFFFMFERSSVPARWRTSLLVASLITVIAGANYALMSSLWLLDRVSPAEFRYLDWFLTVPLICLQFYLLLDASGARPGRGVVWRLLTASLWMLGAGYIGQVKQPEQSVLWGAVSSVGYAMVLFEISFGEAQALSSRTDDPRAKGTFDLLFWFILLGWGIYPLGYMTNRGNLLAGLADPFHIDVIYNVGDAVNKIGFGLVVWNLARQAAPDRVKRVEDVFPAGAVASNG